MEHRDESQKDAATLYAQIIIGWHVEAGADEWRRQFGDEGNESLARYQQAVARFRDSDLSDPAVQLAIAQGQISGSMEWAYSVTIPERLPGLEREHPRLGEIARNLKELASRFPKTRAGTRSVVRIEA